MKRLFFLAGLLWTSVIYAQHFENVWQTGQIFKVPESVLYDSLRGTVYVSNINGNPSEKDGNGFISLINPKGEVIKLQWATGLNAPKGMAVRDTLLYVSDIDRLAVINILTGKIIRFYPAEAAEFLNDVVADDRGNIYVSDSQKGIIYRLDGNEGLKPWLTDGKLKGVNGLAYENRKIIAGSDNYLLSIERVPAKITVLAKVGGGIDGLIPAGNGKYIVSDWRGKISLITKNEIISLNNTTAQKINAADLGYIPDDHLVLVPTFFDNRVVAKKIVW